VDRLREDFLTGRFFTCFTAGFPFDDDFRLVLTVVFLVVDLERGGLETRSGFIA